MVPKSEFEQRLSASGGVALISDTIVLPYCWVCEGDVNLHQHHVIPRNAGGTNGPTVTLCSGCHDGVHDLARILGPKAKLEVWLPRLADYVSTWTTQKRKIRAMYLARIIRNSEALSSSSPNKTVKYSGNLSGPTSRKLKEVSNALNLSQENAIEYCINAVHARIIGGTATDHRKS